MQQPIFIVAYDLDTFLPALQHLLSAPGLRVSQPFVFEEACASFTDLRCPHTGKAVCCCRLAALQVRDASGASLPLVLHQHDRQTEVFTDPDSQPGSAALARQVEQVLQRLLPLKPRPSAGSHHPQTSASRK